MLFFGHKKKHENAVQFDPETQYAVIHSSICTREKAAGFKNKTDGHFTEVMLIRSPADEKLFKETYGIDSLKVESLVASFELTCRLKMDINYFKKR